MAEFNVEQTKKSVTEKLRRHRAYFDAEKLNAVTAIKQAVTELGNDEFTHQNEHTDQIVEMYEWALVQLNEIDWDSPTGRRTIDNVS